MSENENVTPALPELPAGYFWKITKNGFWSSQYQNYQITIRHEVLGGLFSLKVVTDGLRSLSNVYAVESIAKNLFVQFTAQQELVAAEQMLLGRHRPKADE